MSELIKEIEVRLSDMWENKPADIDRMLERKGAAGSNFTVVTFVKMDTQSATNILYMLYNLAKSETGDLETLKKIGIDYLSYLGDHFKNYYSMDDSYCIVMRGAIEARDCDNFYDFAELIRTLQRYLGQLSYWVDFSIPWCELSKEHTRLMCEGAGGI